MCSSPEEKNIITQRKENCKNVIQTHGFEKTNPACPMVESRNGSMEHLERGNFFTGIILFIYKTIVKFMYSKLVVMPSMYSDNCIFEDYFKTSSFFVACSFRT